ncbi:hypothetical protein [Streptomyces sp. MUM 203J]|nr:hypothetical protein [Streptomyces sp. MUM 203J]
MPVTDEVEHHRASGDRAEHSLPGHTQLVQGVDVVRHRLPGR